MTVTGVMKTARLLRLLRVARRVDQYSKYGATVLLLLMASFILISHWLACIFYAIAYFERPRLDTPISWLDQLARKVVGRGVKLKGRMATTPTAPPQTKPLLSVIGHLQCFDAVGWVAGRASGL